MKKKIGHASWFKLFGKGEAVFRAVGNEGTGKAIIAALHLLNTGELEDLDQMAAVVFAAIKGDVDDAVEAYKAASAAGKAGNDKRWGKENQNRTDELISPPDNMVSAPDTPQCTPNYCYPEGKDGKEGIDGIDGKEKEGMSEGKRGMGGKEENTAFPADYDIEAEQAQMRIEKLTMLDGYQR